MIQRDLSARWLSIDQAVALLGQAGVHRHPETIRRWIRLGYLPARRGPGGIRYVRESDLWEAEKQVRIRAEVNRVARQT